MAFTTISQSILCEAFWAGTGVSLAAQNIVKSIKTRQAIRAFHKMFRAARLAVKSLRTGNCVPSCERESGLGFRRRMVIEHEDAVGREVEITGDGRAGEEIVHGLVELDADGGVLVVQQEIDAGVFLLAQADLDGVGHFQEGLDVAGLPEPDDEVLVKMLVAHGADVDGLAEAEIVQGHGRATGVEILAEGGWWETRP